MTLLKRQLESGMNGIIRQLMGGRYELISVKRKEPIHQHQANIWEEMINEKKQGTEITDKSSSLEIAHMEIIISGCCSNQLRPDCGH